MPRKKRQKQKAAGNAAKVFVRVCPLGKGGLKQAEIVRDGQSLGAIPLKKFGNEIQVLLREASPGTTIAVAFIDDPTPSTVTPKSDAQVLRKKRGKPGANRISARSGDSPVHVLTSIGEDGNNLQFDPHPTDKHGNPLSLSVDSLKVTDRFLVARPDAKFKTRDMALAGFAPDVVNKMGLQQEPNIDRNPYNFVPWIGREPNKAQKPEQATHDRIADGRLSGRISITFTAQTPIFVPDGQLRENDDSNDSSDAVGPLDFFHCWNGRCDRYAIPGSSVKGAVRSLFEALTNSRAGVTDDSALGRVGEGEGGPDRYCGPLYRRRATRLFRVVSMPKGGGNGSVQECKYVWYGTNGKPRRSSPNYSDQEKTVFSEQAWRANLFCVGPAGHCHGTKLDYYLDKQCFTLTQETLKQFESMKGHPHLERHGGKKGNASSAQKKMYRDPVPDYSAIEEDLFALSEGDLIFGIPSDNDLHCFGKNVNFLWPGASSPLQMMGSSHSRGRGPFSAREPQTQELAVSDPAEATFGFAGKYTTGNAHPFRGGAALFRRPARPRRADEVECCCDRQQRARRCPRGGRDGRAVAHVDTITHRRQVQCGIERMQNVVTARRAARPRNLHCAGGGFRVAFVLAPLRALDAAGAVDSASAGALDSAGAVDSASAGALGGTRGLPRAALVAMRLQELAYQLLVPPVQFPFEIARAHLPGFARGEEGFGLREDGLGRARRRAAESDAGVDGSHPSGVERTSREPLHHHGHLSPLPELPPTPYQHGGGMSRSGGSAETEASAATGISGALAVQEAGGRAVPAQCALKIGRPTA